MSKWIYEGGREGDHAVTMCEVKGDTLVVQRGPFDWADAVQARGGYQCEGKALGSYPVAQAQVQQPDRLPQVGSEFWPIQFLFIFFVSAVLGYFVAWLWNGRR